MSILDFIAVIIQDSSDKICYTFCKNRSAEKWRIRFIIF